MTDADASYPGTVADPDYCPSCGTELGDPGVFCSACGTQCRPDPGDGPASRVEEAHPRDRRGAGATDRHASSGDRRGGPSGDQRGGRPGDQRGRPAGGGSAGGADADRHAEGDEYGESAREFRRRVEDWQVRGWKVDADRGDSVVLLGRSYGSWGAHVLVFLLTGWFTFGLGNFAYGIYKHQSDPDRVVLRRGGPTAGDPRRETDGSLGNALLGVALFLAGLATLVPLPPDPTGALLSAFLFAAGAAVFPPTRRRIRDRHPATTFGRVRSTDERVVRDPTRACSVCGSSVAGGVERHYREELVVAGVPLVTTDEGTNHYCADCGSGGEITEDPTVEDPIDAELAAIAEERDGETGTADGPPDPETSRAQAGDELETSTD